MGGAVSDPTPPLERLKRAGFGAETSHDLIPSLRNVFENETWHALIQTRAFYM